MPKDKPTPANPDPADGRAGRKGPGAGQGRQGAKLQQAQARIAELEARAERYRASISVLQEELRQIRRARLERIARRRGKKQKDGPSELAARTPRPATADEPGSVDFGTAADLGKGVVIDTRASTLFPPRYDRREMVQLRPYDKRNWGGPDHERVPLSARVTIQGTPRCRFPKAWANERDGLETLKGSYLWGGPLKVHFGHLLVDSVTRLYAYDRDRHDGVVFAYAEGAPLKPWIYPIFRHFGLEPRDIVVVDQPKIVERLDFVAPGSALGQGPSPAYLDHLGELRRRRVMPEGLGRNLYLGRLHLAHRGTLLGESYFARLLEARGFDSFVPERYSLEEQAFALEQAERVVFLEGSSVYSVELLQRSNASFYMIPRRRNSDGLFRGHIEPRGPFFNLGDDTSIQRFTNPNGKIAPNSPSRCRKPEVLHEDLVRHGLIPSEPFDPDAYRAAELADARLYAAGNEARLAQIRAWVEEHPPGPGSG